MKSNLWGMGAILVRHAARRLRSDRGRALLLLSAVGLGISVFVAVLYASDASVRSFRSSLAPLGGEDSVELRAHAGAMTVGQLAVLYHGLRHRFDTLAFWEGRGLAGGKRVDIVAVEPTEARGRFAWLAERSAGGAGAPGWWLSTRLRERLGISPSESSLTVTVGARALTMPLRTIPLDLEHRFPGDILLTTLSGCQALRDPTTITGIKLYPREGTTTNEIAALGQFLAASGETALILANPQQRAAQAERLFAAFRLNIGVLVLMTLVVCAFVVFGAAQLSVLTLQRELGVMRTLGFSRMLLGGVILSESLIVGCLGTILGLTAGRPVTEWCAGLFLKTVSVLYAGGERPDSLWGRPFHEVLLLSLGVGVGLSVLGAALPAIRASKVAPGLVARTRGIAISSSSRWLYWGSAVAAILGGLFAGVASGFHLAWSAHIAAFCTIGAVVGGAWILLEGLTKPLRKPLARFAGVPGLLAAANVISGARVVGVAVAASGVGLSLLIGLGLMVSSFRHTLTEWVAYTIRGDLFIRSVEVSTFDRPARLPVEFEAVARSIAGVREAIGFASFEFDTGTGRITVGGQDFSSHSRARGFHLLAGQLSRDRLLTTDTVIVSESASRKLGVRVGDTVSVAGVTAQVDGVFKDYSSEHGIVLLDLTRFRHHFGAMPLTSAVVVVDDDASIDTVASDFARSVIGAQVSVQRNNELREVIFSIFDQTFQITDLMRGIVALICALGFVLTALQLHEERRHEIGTLVTLGLSRRGLRWSVFIEGILMLTPAVVLGGAGGTILALILIRLVNPLSFGWTLTFVPTAAQYGLPITLIVCSNLIAAALVGIRSARGSWKQEVEDER